MKNRFLIATVVSLLIHAAAAASVAWWALHSANLLGGGSSRGIVEVAVVGSGSGTAVHAERVEARTIRPSTNSGRTETSESRSIGDTGDGGAGGSGGGVGSGTGPGDPRLVTIWKKINRAKYYPEMARRQGVEGAPKVAFSISEDGKVGGVRVVESSGNEILDKAAVEAIQNSTPLPFYPKPITIAVRYSLKDR